MRCRRERRGKGGSEGRGSSNMQASETQEKAARLVRRVSTGVCCVVCRGVVLRKSVLNILGKISRCKEADIQRDLVANVA